MMGRIKDSRIKTQTITLEIKVVSSLFSWTLQLFIICNSHFLQEGDSWNATAIPG
jgi:hypothetical protein